MSERLFIELYQEFTQTQSDKTEEEQQNKESTSFEVDFDIEQDWFLF